MVVVEGPVGKLYLIELLEALLCLSSFQLVVFELAAGLAAELVAGLVAGLAVAPDVEHAAAEPAAELVAAAEHAVGSAAAGQHPA